MKRALKIITTSAFIGCVATSFHPKWAFLAIPFAIVIEIIDII